MTKIIFYILMVINGEPQTVGQAEMQSLKACLDQVAVFAERIEKTSAPDPHIQVVQFGCGVVFGAPDIKS